MSDALIIDFILLIVQDATGNDLTYRVIGAAMAVHNALGPGYREEVYERALAVELEERSIAAQRQHAVEIHHQGVIVALFLLDLWVDDQIVLEIKAFSHRLGNDELAQILNYLKATGAPLGLLFNFGRRRLEFRRVFPGRNAGSGIQRLGRNNVKKSG